MAGNHNSGRKQIDNPKYVQSVRLSVSTLVKIDEISEVSGKSKSQVMQHIIDSAIDAHYKLLDLDK